MGKRARAAERRAKRGKFPATPLRYCPVGPSDTATVYGREESRTVIRTGDSWGDWPSGRKSPKGTLQHGQQRAERWGSEHSRLGEASVLGTSSSMSQGGAKRQSGWAAPENPRVRPANPRRDR